MSEVIAPNLSCAAAGSDGGGGVPAKSGKGKKGKHRQQQPTSDQQKQDPPAKHQQTVPPSTQDDPKAQKTEENRTGDVQLKVSDESNAAGTAAASEAAAAVQATGDVGDNQQQAQPGAEDDASKVASELGSLAAEKGSLEKQRMNDKAVRGLNKTLAECKTTAQGIKGDVLRVLSERTGCEEDCLKLERNIGDKLAALTAEVNKSTKETSATTTPTDKSPEDSGEFCGEPRTPIPVSSACSAAPGGAAAVARDRRSNSKSATPPPASAQDRALQDKITDLSKQDQPKKLSASSKKKAVESVLRSLGDFPTTDDKLRALCELHYETLEQLREAQSTAERWKKQFQTSQKESNRSLLARDRLEGLCRELQKQNNAIKEESALRRREEEEKRKQMAAKLQTTLTDISALMADTQETSTKLRQDNTQLADKLRSLVGHYELWEKHSDNMLKQKTIEAELAMARLREAQLLREKDFKEGDHARRILECATNEMRTQLEASLRNEILLREQLKVHNEKYEQFQEAIVSSNKMFTDFKGEVESMGKQTRKFEKEALGWKQRWEEANIATARVLQEKTKSDIKVETLSRLCRSLQDKLRLDSKELSVMEHSLAGEVVAEERAKLEAELTAKQSEIEDQKRVLEERQKAVQQQLHDVEQQQEQTNNDSAAATAATEQQETDESTKKEGGGKKKKNNKKGKQ